MVEDDKAPEVPSTAPPDASPLDQQGTSSIPLDKDATQRTHLGATAKHPVTISLTLALLIAAFVGGTIAGGSPGIGAAAAGGVLVLAALIVFAIANHRAREDFFNSYAAHRGLTRNRGRSSLPPVTPLLKRGDRRYAEQTFKGTLPGGAEGTLAHYTYEDSHTDSEGNRETTYFHFTVVVADIPEAAERIMELFCQRRVGFRFLDSFEDVFRSKKRIEVESASVDKKFEIFADSNCDEGWIRQLFSPSFIVWLDEHTPDGLAFELVAGVLVVNRKGHLSNTTELDQMCEAASAVIERIRDESLEPAVGG